MTKHTSATIALYKKLAILPLLAAAIILFSQKSIAENTVKPLDGNVRNSKKVNSMSLTKASDKIDTPKKVKSATINFMKPRGLLQIMINYPSTKAGASPEQLKEYAAFESRYINAKGNIVFEIGRDLNISAADRPVMEDLFAKMSKEQQKQQKIAFTYFKPFLPGVPTQKQIDTWANDKQYKIVLDDKLVGGAELAKHKATDFSHFYIAHIEWQIHRKHKYQHYEIQLMTTPYFTAKNEERTKNSHVIYNIQPGIRQYMLNSKNGKTVMEVSAPVVQLK